MVRKDIAINGTQRGEVVAIAHIQDTVYQGDGSLALANTLES